MVVNNLAIRQKTPIGARFIKIVTSLSTTVFKSSNTLATRLPDSPLSAIAIPNKRAKTITCNMLPSAIALIGLVGNMLMIT